MVDKGVNCALWRWAVWGPCSKLSLLVVLFSMVSLGPLNLRIPQAQGPGSPASLLPGTGGHSLAHVVPWVPCRADKFPVLTHLGEHQQPFLQEGCILSLCRGLSYPHRESIWVLKYLCPVAIPTLLLALQAWHQHLLQVHSV